MEIAEQKELFNHLSNTSTQLAKAELTSARVILVSRLRKGDRAAAQELVDQYYERLYLYLRELGHTRHASEDLLQETFMRAWYNIGQLRDDKALAAWLYRIASNISSEHWRKQKRIDRINQQKLALADHISQESESDRADLKEVLGQLRDAIAVLPWKLRQAVVLHYLQSFTIADGAKAAGIKEGTFKSRLNRALTILRRQFG